MLHHFECPPSKYSLADSPLVFDWDDETGEVSGRDAERILARFRRGTVAAHPIPWGWDLTSTKNRADMAAVIGYCYELPPVLADAYPQPEPVDDNRYDEDGNVIGKHAFCY